MTSIIKTINPTGSSWADIDDAETLKEQKNFNEKEKVLNNEVVKDNDERNNKQQEEVLDDNNVVELLDEVVEVLDDVVEQNKDIIQEIQNDTEELVTLPKMFIASYPLMDLLDGNNKLIFYENINEITKIIIGKGGYYLKNITAFSGVISLWCRTDENNKKHFDVHLFHNDLYGGQIAFWMLKKRVNYVVMDFYERRNYNYN